MKKLQAFKQRQGHDIGGVRPVMIPDDAGEWVSRHDAEHQIERISAQRDELLKALVAALEWIDAVPSETALPAMPGFDRDEVNNLISSIKGGAE